MYLVKLESYINNILKEKYFLHVFPYKDERMLMVKNNHILQKFCLYYWKLAYYLRQIWKVIAF